MSLAALSAGVLTVLVGFASSSDIAFQPAAALGATPQQIGSWIWALELHMGLSCIAFLLHHRMPLAGGTWGAACCCTSA